MNVLNFNSEQCARVRRQLDAYFSNELLVETTGEVLRHLEGCEACSRELEARHEVAQRITQGVGEPGSAGSAAPVHPAAAYENATRLLRRSRDCLGGGARCGHRSGGLATQQWIRVQRGRRIVASVMAIGVADHVQCAIKGHNYPNVANPPECSARSLGPAYAGLLAVVQRKLPGFEVLEAHICSIPGSPRKYVHFITRGAWHDSLRGSDAQRGGAIPQRNRVPIGRFRRRPAVSGPS